MKISIITLFPDMFKPVLNTSILGRAQKKGKVEFQFINLRDFGEGPHLVVDGRPYGGGAGMVLRADILTKALKSIVNRKSVIGKNTKRYTINDKPYTILAAANGKPFKQMAARKLSKIKHLVFICGHYEGVDQRFIDNYVTAEYSIGDFVLTGGELPTMLMADAIVRLIPGVLEKPEAVENESFTENLLEGPQYTRPDIFEGKAVPEILKSGHHAQVDKWRKEEGLKKTKKTRPDLLK